jgi:hypothetical protein
MPNYCPTLSEGTHPTIEKRRWLKPVLRAPRSVQSDLAAILANCNPECSTASVSGCFDALLGSSCEDFQDIADFVGTQYVDEFCSDVQSGMNYLNSPEAASDFSLALNWYQNSFAPCVGQICSGSSSPVDANQLSQAPSNLIKRVAESQIGKVDLFFLKYGLIVTLILLGVIFVLIFTMILKSR